MKKSQLYELVLDVVLVLIGSALYAFGFYYFIVPFEIAPGGVSGISVLVNYASGLPVGLVNAVINLPLLLIGWKFLGRDFILKTLLSVAAFTVLIDYVFPIFPVYQGERLIACLFGGVLVGAGLGIVFWRSGSTGGADIVVKLINRKFPQISLGNVALALDFCVIAASAVVFGSIESALYAIITIYLSSQVVDLVVYGQDKGKLVYIISDQSRQVADVIIKNLERGATFVESEGAYTGEPQRMVMCAVRKNEYHKLKKLVHQADPRAFLIASDSSEVVGEGFKSMQES